MKRDNKRLPDHVLGIVSRLVVTDEASGWVARITDGQLDRKDYVALNEALEALGGKWNRKLRGHAFGRSPREAIGDLLLTGEFKRATAGDFFQTPPALAKRMAEWALSSGDRVLEPSAGLGRIAEAVRATSPEHRLIVVEKDAARAERLQVRFGTLGDKVIVADFLSCTPQELGTFDAVVMNPPFSQAQECAHVLHALSFLRPGGRLISVASAGVRYRKDKPYVALRERLDELEAEVEDLPDGTFEAEGTSVRTVLIKVEL